jgi:hypothetical protein
LHAHRSDLFPYPWSSFHFSAQSLVALIPGAILLLLTGIGGLLLLIAAIFGELAFPKGPRFPLPKELQYRQFRFPISHEFFEEEAFIDRTLEESKRVE